MKFYITTPIYYVNAPAHIGHAYTSISCDCLARFHRMRGDSVYFLTGTDEHGQKIYKSAEAQNCDIKLFVDRAVEKFCDLWRLLDIKYDNFIRTTYDFHKEAVQRVFSLLYDKKYIYKDKYKGWYCIHCETFWSNSQVESKGYLCLDCHRKLEFVEEENYFLKLSYFQDWLIDYLKSHKDFVKPSFRYNEIMSFLENNRLTDLCVSRSSKNVKWGIPVPFDSNYVIYVWFDALVNYISAIGWGSNSGDFLKWWPADLHVIGKDILRQHAVYWPIILKAMDLPLPKSIFAHGWWMVGEEKMSKSKGNIVDPYNLVETFGVDALRFFLLREIPFGLDGNFSQHTFAHRVNSDLANDLGNLVYRTLSMSEKYFQGKISLESIRLIPKEFQDAYEKLKEGYEKALLDVDFISALELVWELISKMNKFIEDSKPWIMFKNKDWDNLKVFIYSLLEGIRIIGIFIYPFMPKTAISIFTQLNYKDYREESLLKSVEWGISEGFVVNKGDPLFPRLDVD